ncbi:MAG: hypothetical protein HFJ09_11510 [Lachnospiraceae bacterium]|nr:hypothetical protein [Lachnospiraceae bacterium]
MKNLKHLEVTCFILASILGTISHFFYDWSGQNYLVGLIFPKNESTWEHLKLIFFPILFVSVLEYFFLKVKTQNYTGAKFFSTLIGMVVTIVVFYTYQGVLGYNIEVVNIAIYFLAMSLAYLFSYHTIKEDTHLCLSEFAYYICFWFMGFLFICFSVFPPNIGLFQSPI